MPATQVRFRISDEERDAILRTGTVPATVDVYMTLKADSENDAREGLRIAALAANTEHPDRKLEIDEVLECSCRADGWFDVVARLTFRANGKADAEDFALFHFDHACASHYRQLFLTVEEIVSAEAGD